MGTTLSKAVSAIMLLLTSNHCLNRVQISCYYAKAAYRLYFFCGMASLIRICMGPSLFLDNACETLFVWTYVLGLPLLSADITKYSVYGQDFAALHMIIPTAVIILYHINPAEIDPYLLGVSHSLSIASVVLCGLYSNIAAPFAFALTYFFAMFRLDPKELPSTEAYLEMWYFLSALGNMFALQILPRRPN